MRSVFYFLLPTFYLLVANALCQSPGSPALAFNGTWKNVETGDTITIQITGGTAQITTSGGGHGEGLFGGSSILYSGQVDTDQGKVKTLGTYELDDPNTLIKHREIYYDAGTQEETVRYQRVTPGSSIAKPTAKSTPEQNAAPIASATPKPTRPPPTGFGGTWRPADDSARLTITVNGSNAFLKYSPGSRDSGTIRAGKIECQGLSRGDGIKSTDVFEMSGNGRTLIRRRTLESAKGEVGHETLTYNRAE